ncbi:MAG: transporter, partial [Paramuribaculum sp.]|nr:transporter [Paramuribaculum sp.]
IPTCAWLALVAAVACAFQFIAGRVIGHFAGDPVSGAQGLGQKNTVLAIWMALTYLNPLSSIAPAAYVAFQNTVNSVQLYFRQRRNARSDTSHG